MNTLIDECWLIAIEAHNGQVGKHDNRPYLEHVYHVWLYTKEAGGTEIDQAIAILHDVIEDSSFSLNEISNRIFFYKNSDVVLRGVDAITKRSGESNVDYCKRMKETSAEACFVKMKGDQRHNLERLHLITDPEAIERLGKKASLYMKELGQYL